MILLGHIGITTAIIKKYEKLDDKDIKFLIDYRFVFIGSILPDLIDKTIEIFANHRFPPYGRMYAHSLVFAGILLIIGMIRDFKHINVFILGLCSLIHILIDGMWLDPKIFLFPTYGVNLLGKNYYMKIPYISAIFGSSAYLIIGEMLGGFLLYKYIKERLYKNKMSLRMLFKYDVLITSIKRLMTRPIHSSTAVRQTEQG